MTRKTDTSMTATARLSIALILGAAVAAVVGRQWQTRYVLLAGWDTVAVVFGGTALFTILRFNAEQTRDHALRENPGRPVADLLLLVASVASIAAVIILLKLGDKSHGSQKLIDMGLGLFSIVLSWFIVHTMFLLKYARQYYGDPEGGIDFNEKDPPRYADFAYLAFTVGMTFQVSDTNIKTKEIRATILKQALLSYVFGTAIIATTINILVNISS